MPRVNFNRTVTVPAATDRVWTTVTDVDRLVSWISVLGAATTIAELESYSAVLEDRMGPFRMRADLAITIPEVEPNARIVVHAEGEDRQIASRITVDAVLMIGAGEHGGSVVEVEGSYEVAGRVATMGASTIQKKADKLMDEFFTSLERDLT